MIIINGELTEGNSLRLDDGYQFGRGVFETIMIRDKALFLKEHCQRMEKGMEVLRIENSINEDYIGKCIEKFQIKNCVLKVIVSGKNIVIITRESKYLPEDYAKGFKLKLGTVMRNESSPLTYIKSLNYSDNILEKESAATHGYDEVLFLNTKGEVTEGAISNIFFVKNNKIFTPAVECGLLDGIVRMWVINNFKVEEGHYSFREVEEADEVFLTNSVIGVMKVCKLMDKSFEENTVVGLIRDKYQDFICNWSI